MQNVYARKENNGVRDEYKNEFGIKDASIS